MIFLETSFNSSIGILGLGFPHTSAPSFVVEAYQRSLIPAPAYSMILGRYADVSKGLGSDGSLLVLGGYDETLVDGPINWINCSATIHFQIPMDGIILNGLTIKLADNRPMQTIIDVCIP